MRSESFVVKHGGVCSKDAVRFINLASITRKEFWGEKKGSRAKKRGSASVKPKEGREGRKGKLCGTQKNRGRLLVIKETQGRLKE